LWSFPEDEANFSLIINAMKINIFYQTKISSYLKKTRLFKKAVEHSLKYSKDKRYQKSDVNLIFVNSKKIKELNKTFLNKTYETDVIAFNYPDNINGVKTSTFGDVFVCFERAKKQAKEYKHSILKELFILSVHGALHLGGFDDKTAKQKQKMDNLTYKILEEIL